MKNCNQVCNREGKICNPETSHPDNNIIDNETLGSIVEQSTTTHMY